MVNEIQNALNKTVINNFEKNEWNTNDLLLYYGGRFLPVAQVFTNLNGGIFILITNLFINKTKNMSNVKL